MRELFREHPIFVIWFMGTITGIFPALICGLIFKILGLE